MDRAGVVKHPGEWDYGGYCEIQNPKQRYTLIDRQKLTGDNPEKLKKRLSSIIVSQPFLQNGMVNRKVLPLPLPSLSNHIRPPCSSTIFLLNESPSPVP